MTKILEMNGGYQLIRGDEPYFVRGAVAPTRAMGSISAAGANSIRTRPRSREELDQAQAFGLSVLCGLPVRAQRSGMDYSDKTMVAKQFDEVMGLVRAWRDHPAVLCWELGNELDYINYLVEPDWAVYDAVNALAEAIHQEDTRPVLTVMGASNWKKIGFLCEQCPALDLLGVNAYGDLAEAPAQLLAHGWHKPYLVTEWGPTGWWQMPRTAWDIAYEETSSEKALVYQLRYESIILADAARCLGSYVFLWAQHQERTHTWFGMVDAEGRETEAIDVMRYEWNGAWPAQRAPRISPIILQGGQRPGGALLAPGGHYSAAVMAVAEDGGPLSFAWEILRENPVLGYAGSGERRPEPCPGIDDARAPSRITFAAPVEEGDYRVFVYVYDTHNHVATANFPFHVGEGAEIPIDW